ncbi:MAG: tetratricopeptide repeat protein [Gemmatimonadota bacterium]|jgi:tetratricopeptide (TPR) repeat protein|nr:tetratricopeptide repeat protein [Gemmatimonadota bacterium]
MQTGNPVDNESTGEYSGRIEQLRKDLQLPPEEFTPLRVRVRDELITMVHELDRRIAALMEMKAELRPLVERYKQITRSDESTRRSGAATGSSEGAGRAGHDLESGATGGTGEETRSGNAVAGSRGPGRIDHLGSSTYRERGWSALAGGDYDRAVAQMEKALTLDPDSHANLSLLAWSYLHLEKPDRAQPLIQRVLGENMEHAQARLCLGYLYLHESRFTEAVELLLALTKEEVDMTTALYAHLYLGIAHTELQLFEDAERCFLRALELGPNLAEGYWELGRSRQRQGRDDLALEAWRLGAENRFNPWGKKCREAVERMTDPS